MLQRQLADVGVQWHQVHRRQDSTAGTEDVGRPLKQLARPMQDLPYVYQIPSSVIVLSSNKAAKAICALIAGLWLRCMRRADFLTIENSFLPSLPWPGFAPEVSTYRSA